MIVLIDGDCALCVGLVEWLGKRIPANKLTPENIMFVPGESDWGKELLNQSGVNNFDSVVVLSGAEVFQESEAVLALAEVLPARWQAAVRLARVVPRPARDSIYRWIARNRISWFGRKELCAVNPTAAPVTYGPRGLLKRR